MSIIYKTLENGSHDMVGHPECAERVVSVIKAIQNKLTQDEYFKQQVFKFQTSRLATNEELSLAHNQLYVNGLQKLIESPNQEEIFLIESQGPTYATQSTYNILQQSCGLALDMADYLMDLSLNHQLQQNQIPGAFTLCRPPGHHAIQKGPMGFCIFNNIAIAAKYVQKKYNIERVVIFDFDGHHGNGTEEIFYNDPNVLFISTHQARAFPHTGAVNEVGAGEGQGSNINIPLEPGSGHSLMLETFEKIIGPAIERFKPGFIFVSAGYDAHWRDPLLSLQLRTSTYHYLVQQTKRLADKYCKGRLLFILEGGYDLKGLSESVIDSMLGIIERPSDDKFNPDLLLDEPLDKGKKVIKEAQIIHSL